MRSHVLASVMALSSATSIATASPPDIQRHVCDNGLEVLVVENHSVPLVTVEIAARNGAMTEPPELSGLSHLYEHMFFKANATIPSQEAYMARVRELGMSFNGTTGTERVNYFFTTTSDRTAESMVFMRDAITSPLFDQAELDREKVVVTAEMDRAEANPFFLLSRAVDRRVWYRHPTRKDPLGSRTTVLTATSAKLRTIQQRYYVPNNAVLVVTGDVSASDIFAQADRLYVDWKRGPDPFERFPLVEHPPLRQSSVVSVVQDVQTFVGSMVWHGPSAVAGSLEATYAADAFGTALAEPSSRFQKNLVDSGACVSAHFGWYTQRNVGPITLSFQAAPGQVDRCIEAVMAELDAMATAGYVTDDELARAARRLEIEQIEEREKPSELAHVITFWWASAGLDYYLGYAQNLKKVRSAGATRFVTTYVTGKPFVFGALVSDPMVADGLSEQRLASLARISPSARRPSHTGSSAKGVTR